MSFFSFVGDIFGGLLNVFITGPASNPDVLYILIPVYVNWLVNDYYQERRGTDLGNAAANGFTAIWVGIDWFRTMVPRVGIAKVWTFSWYFLVFKFLIAFLVLLYGLTIMKYAVTGNKIATKIGRIREVSYVCIVFTPFVYDLIKTSTPSFSAFLPTFVGILLFFPVFYYLAEYILNEVLPAPPTEAEEDGEEPAVKQKPSPRPPPQVQKPQPRPQPSQQRPAQPGQQPRPNVQPAQRQPQQPQQAQNPFRPKEEGF